MNDGRRRRVLVTRPEADAAPLARRLAGMGIDAVIAPLMTVEATGAAVDLAGVQALLLTSANGPRALAPRAEVPRDLPVLAVGDATAAAAREAGFASVESADGDVDDLARLAAGRLDPAAGALLHVAGSVRAGDLAAMLHEAGFAVRRTVLYEAVAAERLPDAARDVLQAGNLDGVLLYSPRSARLFEDLAAAAGLDGALARLDAFCLSANVEAALRGPWRSRHVAPDPAQDSLLAALAACYD